MRKLKIFERISLDGVIQVRGSGRDGNYPHGAPVAVPLAEIQPSQRIARARSAAWPTHLRHLVGFLAEGADQPYL